MSLSPRLLIVAAALAVLASSAVIHLLPHPDPLAGRPLFAPTAAPPSPAPLVVPQGPTTAGPSAWLPPVLRAPGGFWRLLNRDTAATTGGQIGVLRLLESTLRDQLRSLLQHPLAGV